MKNLPFVREENKSDAHRMVTGGNKSATTPAMPEKKTD